MKYEGMPILGLYRPGKTPGRRKVWRVGDFAVVSTADRPGKTPGRFCFMPGLGQFFALGSAESVMENPENGFFFPELYFYRFRLIMPAGNASAIRWKIASAGKGMGHFFPEPDTHTQLAMAMHEISNRHGVRLPLRTDKDRDVLAAYLSSTEAQRAQDLHIAMAGKMLAELFTDFINK